MPRGDAKRDTSDDANNDAVSDGWMAPMERHPAGEQSSRLHITSATSVDADHADGEQLDISRR